MNQTGSQQPQDLSETNPWMNCFDIEQRDDESNTIETSSTEVNYVKLFKCPKLMVGIEHKNRK